MSIHLPAWAGAFALLGSVTVLAAESNEPTTDLTSGSADRRLETVRVYGERRSEFGTALITDDRVQHGAADVARLLALMPGVDVNENGAITGQIQYRGMFGPRLDVRVNGMKIPAGGPNWMDPPMHYVPRGLLHSATLERGIADVSHSGIGGAAAVAWKRPDYVPQGGWQTWADVDSTARSVDDGHELAATVGLASAQQRIYLAGSDESADDYQAGDGSVAGTEFERSAYGLGYGLQLGQHAVDVHYHRIDSNDAGTPSLPMDIDFFDTDIWRGEYRWSRGASTLSLSAGISEIEHGMSNSLLRPAPDIADLPLPPFARPDRRQVDADSRGREVRAAFTTPVAGGVWEAGVDWLTESHDATVRDPDFAPFFVDNFADAEQTQTALFSQWQGALTAATQLEVGVRYARVESDADEVDAFPASLVDANPGMWPAGTPPRAVWALRERFNAADRSRSADLVDWVVALQRDLSPSLQGEIALGRKSRAPLYQELFLWIPLEANAGLGDGNNYVGNLALDPEVAHQLEVGLEWRSGAAYLTPRAHYRRIDDYIHGVPAVDPVVVAVSANTNGDPTPLVFGNVDAEIYGLDVGFGMGLTETLRLDGNASWVRGKRRDIDDDLYRIAPPSLRVGLTWQRGPWRVMLEQVLVADQAHVSASLTDDPLNERNSFAEIDGHALTNLYAGYDVSSSLRLDVGVENLFDEHYVDPLSGFNRNGGSAVPVGQRLPGRGVNAFARVWYRLNQ